MNYKNLNNYLGWFVFLIATIVYFITIEDTVSLWDCGEYITAAYKLEVGHPPGAPLFMVLGRLFSFFAEPENVAVWINRLSALSSSLTILFMFWSITLLTKKIALKAKNELSKGDQIAIFGSAIVGSLAYTFSDSFWFSAVEGEVYAMSSLFTAVIFWAILKWDEEYALQQQGLLSDDLYPNRWLLIIMFMLGLAIGVHLLGILVVPSIVYMIFFRTQKDINVKNFLLIGILGVFILGFIQEGIIPGTISLASKFEVGFTNSLGLPFYSGTIFFFLALIGLSIYFIRYARKKSNPILYNAMMGFVLLLIGYSSFAVIVIRSNANPPLDENDPENLVTLYSYLKREQYGSAPLLNGQYWNSKENDPSAFGDQSAFYLRRFVVTKGDQDVKAFRHENMAKKYAKEVAGSVEEKYYESNAAFRENSVATYAQTTFFPRMYWNAEAQRIEGYKKWSGYDASEDKGTEKGKDGLRLPSFGENLAYFFDYQVSWMYWRYFMWNFAGRQNDIQGHGDDMRGNWISGFSVVDNAKLGNQSDAPYFTTENKSNNKFFFIPLIFGIIGLLYHFLRAPKDAFVLLLAFILTGVAIVVYLNQKPLEPRERDYAFAASFYFFAFWIGIGVYALYESFKNISTNEVKKLVMYLGAFLVLFFMADMNSPVSMPKTISWIIISVGILALVGLMMGLRKVLKENSQGAIIATVLGLFVPIIMGMQGWDDHDRSLKTSARDLAYNYLESCTENSILFTNGDNDTFPLWYMQEVEGKRTDVRVCNLSLMQTDWYTEQMLMRAYKSDPLPIKFREDQILMAAGNTDQVLFSNLFELFYINAQEDVIQKIIDMRVKTNPQLAMQTINQFALNIPNLLNGMTSTQPNVIGRLEEIKKELATPVTQNVSQKIYGIYRNALEILSGVQSGLVTLPQENAQKLQDALLKLEDGWNYTDIKEAMAFVRDDKNLVTYDAKRKVRFFPSSGFILKVNKENAVKSGLISAKEKAECLDELKFNFDSRGITREQVMMMDIIANNDWKRGIFFSSPGGSEVSVALYSKGYIKQNGMAFELSPLKNLNVRMNADKMYELLMNKYSYGAMNNPDVLTDYYSRRHTAQFRLHFATLAEFYLNEADDIEMNKSQVQNNIDMLRKTGANTQADELEKSFAAKGNAKELRKKADLLIKKSLAVMPAEIVIDYGEPTGSRDKYAANGIEMPAYSDGILHDYVAMLYRSGDKEAAEKLGATVSKQLASIVNFFVKSDPYFAGNPENNSDLFASLDAYFKLHMAAIDPTHGNQNGTLAKTTKAQIDQWYKKDFKVITDALKSKASENGESVSTGKGYYANMYVTLHDYFEAIGMHYGYIPNPNKSMPINPNLDNIDLNQLMNQAPGDTVLE